MVRILYYTQESGLQYHFFRKIKKKLRKENRILHQFYKTLTADKIPEHVRRIPCNSGNRHFLTDAGLC